MKIVGRVKPGCDYPEGDIVELEPGEKLFYFGFATYELHDAKGHEIAHIGKNHPYAYGFLLLAQYEDRNHEKCSLSYVFDPRLIASCIKATIESEETDSEEMVECVPFENLDEAVRYIREHLKTVNEDPGYEKDPATGFFCLHEIFKGHLSRR